MEGFKTRERQAGWHFGQLPRGDTIDGFPDCCNVTGRGAAASTNDIDQTVPRQSADNGGRLIRRFIITTEGIRQSGIGMYAQASRRGTRQIADKGRQLFGTEGTVETNGKRPNVLN